MEKRSFPAGAVPDLRVVTWDRNNVVKHALSYLKHNHMSDCGAALANHGHSPVDSRRSPVVLVHANAPRLAAEVVAGVARVSWGRGHARV